MDTYYFKFARSGGKSYQTQWMMYKMLVLEELGICKFKPMIIRKEKNMERMTHLASLKHYNEGALVPVWKCENLAEWKYIVETDGYGMPDHYILGPAIDRLYEYEQLGMTPAEIRDGLKHAHELRNENKKLNKERIGWRQCADGTYFEKNAEIDKLNKIIADLRNDKRLLEMANMDLHTNMNVISGENKRLRAQNEKYDLVIHTIEQLFGCAFDI